MCLGRRFSSCLIIIPPSCVKKCCVCWMLIDFPHVFLANYLCYTFLPCFLEKSFFYCLQAHLHFFPLVLTYFSMFWGEGERGVSATMIHGRHLSCCVCECLFQSLLIVFCVSSEWISILTSNLSVFRRVILYSSLGFLIHIYCLFLFVLISLWSNCEMDWRRKKKRRDNSSYWDFD